MALKSDRVVELNPQQNVCISNSAAPTFAPMESIKERRERFGITQKELADVCGCSFSHISHIEHGRAMPSLEVFAKLSEELKVSPAKMLDILKLRSGKAASASVTDLQRERERRKRRSR